MHQSNLDSYVASMSSGASREDILGTVADMYLTDVDFKLMTVTTIDSNLQAVKRIWSSSEKYYPVGGYKPFDCDEWTDIILKQQKTVVCHDVADLIRLFPDHEAIVGMGCGSGINVPIVLKKQVIGTVNLFHIPNWFDAARVARACELVAFLYAPMLQTHQ